MRGPAGLLAVGSVLAVAILVVPRLLGPDRGSESGVGPSATDAERGAAHRTRRPDATRPAKRLDAGPTADRGRIVGRVLRVITDEPIEDVTVRLSRPEAATGTAEDASTDADGTFVFDSVLPGRWLVRTGGHDHPPEMRASAEVRVEAGASSHPTLRVNDMGPTGGVLAQVSVRYARSDRVPKEIGIRLRRLGDGRGWFAGRGRDGRCEVRVPSLGRFHLYELHADGESHEECRGYVFLEAGKGLALILDEPAEAIVLAVDAATRSPIATALASRREDLSIDSSAAHPLVAQTDLVGMVRAEESGRIRMGKGLGVAELVVGAPGYAWTAITVPFDGSVKTVSLVRGGSLRLRVENWAKLEEPIVSEYQIPPDVVLGPDGEFEWNLTLGSAAEPADDAEVAVEVTEADEMNAPGAAGDDDSGGDRDALFFSTMLSNTRGGFAPDIDSSPVPLLAPSGEVLLQGLAPGQHAFLVRRGESNAYCELYGAGTVTIRRGETVTLAIPTTPSTAGTLAPITGKLTVPEGWGPGPFLCRFDGNQPTNAHVHDLAMLETSTSDDSALGIRTEPIPPGRYRVTIDPTRWGVDVTVPEGGADYRWSLPQPGVFRVRALDATSRAPVADAAVMCRAQGPAEQDRFTIAWNDPYSEESDPERVWIRRALPGPATLLVESEGYFPESVSVDAVAGVTTNVEVLLRRCAGVVVRVRLDGAPFRSQAPVEVNLRALHEVRETDGAETEVDASDSSLQLGSGSATFDGLLAGSYEVELDGLAGFESGPRRRVDVRAGETAEVVIDLVRQK